MMFGGMFLFWLIPLVLLIIGVGWLFGNRNPDRTGSMDTPQRRSETTPQEILRERYARGEITKEEFEEMRSTLES